ncbi:MAG: PQQ-like beta-propeller repeat protein, partial [Actinobacteria bacterium]|nr:PQQ-like beta-propeller repeat protein [Actinomycetota bacterium]
MQWTSDVAFGAIDGNVAYGIGPSGLTAVSIDNGRVLWSASVVDGTQGVIGATDGKIFVWAYSTAPGDPEPAYFQVWDASTHKVAYYFFGVEDGLRPAISNGTVYFVRELLSGPGGHALYAADEATGHQLWSVTIPVTSRVTSPVVSRGYVFWSGATYRVSDGKFV